MHTRTRSLRTVRELGIFARATSTAALLMLLSLLVAGGCGENSAELPENNLQTPGDLADAPPDQEIVDPQGLPCCILLPAGVADYEVNMGANFELAVYLFSRESGEPVANRLISWTIDGQGDASLSAFETSTNDEGLARVTLRSGSALTSYTITARFEDVRPVEYTVTVADLPSGDMLVNVINAGGSQVDVAPFDVGIYYASDIDCRHFNPLSLPGGAIATGQAAFDGDQLVFEGLLTGYEYTILGVGYGPNGNVVAKGCIDREVVFEENAREVDLIFQLVPLNPVGTYRVRSYYDFGDAIAASGTIGEYIVMIFDGFNNPGGLLFNVLIDLCGQIAPGFVCDAIDWGASASGLRDEAEQVINDLVLSSETGCRIVRAGCDARSAIRTLETVGTLYMSKLGTDFRVYGTTTYTGLAYYWRQDCPVGSPPDCGRTELSYGDMLDLNIVSGDWEGTVTSYDHVIIGAHGVDLNYGELIVFLINNVVLPEIAGGATSFSQALEHWFNCDGFANWLKDVEVFDQSLSYETSYDICAGAVGLLNTVLSFGTALLSLQEFSSVLTLSGEVTLVESTGDFSVDTLIEGKWNGTINFNGATSPVRGGWSGCRIESFEGVCEIPPVDFNIQGGDGTCACDAMCNCAE